MDDGWPRHQLMVAGTRLWLLMAAGSTLHMLLPQLCSLPSAPTHPANISSMLHSPPPATPCYDDELASDPWSSNHGDASLWMYWEIWTFWLHKECKRLELSFLKFALKLNMRRKSSRRSNTCAVSLDRWPKEMLPLSLPILDWTPCSPFPSVLGWIKIRNPWAGTAYAN